MSSTIYLSVSALIYTVLIAIVFFSKKKFKTSENNIYSKLIVISILSLISELYIALAPKDENFLPFVLSMKAYLVFCISWLSIFMEYVFVITRNEKDRFIINFKSKYQKQYNIFRIITIILCIVIIFLPINYFDDGMTKYSYGLSVNVAYTISAIYLVATVVYLIKNIKNIKEKGYKPIIIFVFLVIGVAIVQKIDPGLLIINATLAFITTLMYHTIENPDVKLVRELELAKDNAEKANMAKSDFLSSMSHEIRTPLNIIIGSAQMLQDEKLSDESKENLNVLLESSENLLDIGSSILDITQIESGKVEIIEENYSPKTLFTDLYTLLKKKVNDKVEFVLEFNDEIPEILYGDKNKIRQITTNLLTNAIKYTDNGLIVLSINCIKENNLNRLKISVKDTGRGIKDEMKSKIFEKFSRADEVKNSKIEGFGLGLSITDNLVETLNGKITLESEYGQGSCFTVEIPQKNQIVEKVDESEAELKMEINAEDNMYKVLIVDDNKMNLNIEKNLLNKDNFNCDICESGEECIEKVKEDSSYDAILLDDMMPSLSGTDTMKILKQDVNYKKPIIVVTANVKSTDKDEYLKAGFDEYIPKPVSMSTFGKKVKEIIKNYIS